LENGDGGGSGWLGPGSVAKLRRDATPADLQAWLQAKLQAKLQAGLQRQTAPETAASPSTTTTCAQCFAQRPPRAHHCKV
jgi:hypothetical protein